MLVGSGCGGDGDEESETALAPAVSTEAPTRDPEVFCTEFAKLDDLADLPRGTLAERREGAAKLVAVLKRSADLAPDEIVDAVDTSRDYFAELKRLADEATSIDGLETAVKALPEDDEEAAETAGSRIESWVEDNCG